MAVTEEVLSAFGPAQKRSLADEVAERLYAAIVSGHLKPGQRINEGDVAERFQISRGPVREALASLAAQGLVIKEANWGTFVASLSLQDIEEVCTLRAALELLAVQRVVHRLDALDMREMERLARSMEPSTGSEEAERKASGLDLQFHAVLVAAAGHRRLLDAWNNLRSQLQMLLRSNYAVDESPGETAVEEHLKVLAALRKGDGTLAGEALKHHLDLTYNRLHRAYLSRGASMEES